MESGVSHRSIKIDITNLLDSSQKEQIDYTIKDSIKVFNLFTKLGCEHKSTSYMRLHHVGYEISKEMCPDMNTGMIQSTAKSALGAIKAWNTKNKKNKWKYEGNKNAEAYSLNKLTLSKRGKLYTFSTNGKRIRLILDIPTWFNEKYPDGELCSGTVQRKGGKYFLSLTFKVENKEQQGGKVIGVDRGLYNIIATSEGELHSSKHLHAVERRYQYTKSTLQSKGTRSAKRRLKAISGREMRFKADVDHCISKALSSRDDVSCYVLEDLKGIQNKRRGKKLNRWLHKWSSFRLETFLEYKCAFNGISVMYVSPAHTSQTCNVCGSVDKEARDKSKYVCKACGHSDHADINASKNIRTKYLLSLEGESGRIQPSECSDLARSVTIP